MYKVVKINVIKLNNNVWKNYTIYVHYFN